MSLDYSRLTGSDKAAVLVLSLPPEMVREYLSALEDAEVERVLAAVARIDDVPPDLQKKVLSDFQNRTGRRELTAHGGSDRAREIAEFALGSERADRVLDRLGEEERRVEWTLRAYSPDFIAETISTEHPQTVALLLSQLPADRGAEVIAALPETIRSEVVLSLAELESVTTDVIDSLEQGVADLFGRPVGAATRVGGTDAAAKLLNKVAKTEGAAILDLLEERDPELAGTIRNRMLTFDDLAKMDNRGFQTLLREVATEDLVKALRAASDEIAEKVFSNVSKRAADQIREEMDLMGPMKLAEVEEVQQKIVAEARRLEEEGKLSIGAGGDDEVLV